MTLTAHKKRKLAGNATHGWSEAPLETGILFLDAGFREVKGSLNEEKRGVQS